MFRTKEERDEHLRSRRDEHQRLSGQFKSKRLVVCAAIRVGDEVICGARHYDPVMVAQITARSDGLDWRTAEQGFIDQWGTFMDRDEAYKVAKWQGQIRHPDVPGRGLFSEHLY
jgi:hypothetical protein